MISRKEFSERFFVLKGKPFSLKDYKYLAPLYLDRVKSRRIILKSGRQIAKSQTLCNICLIDCFQIPSFNSLYITFTQQQMLAFAHQKVDPLLAESKLVKEHFLKGPYVRDATRDKRFSNNSTFFLRHCYLTADSVRGVSSDHVVVDELASILTDNISVIEETTAHSPYKWVTYAGTPTTEDSAIEDQWERSTQNEWMLICPFCNNRNYQDIEIIGDTGLVCKKCHSLMPKERLKGEWLSFNQDALTVGFRFTQLAVPWMDHKEIIYRLKTYPTYRFYNEVLGLPYSVSETALGKDELLRCINVRHPNTIDFARKFRMNHLVAGLDWGGGAGLDSFTVLTVGYHEAGLTKVLYCKKFTGAEADALRQIDIISDICRDLNVRLVFADYGMGVVGNPLLQQKLAKSGIPLFPIMYTNQKEMLAWIGLAQRYQANRTTSLGRLFSDIKQGRLEFPNLDPDIYKDLLNVRISQRLVGGTDIMFYDHRRDEPDDLTHALNYLHLGAPLIHPYL